MYKYTLVEQDEKIEKFHKERIEAFDNLEARLDNVKKYRNFIKKRLI
jgi:hypothetical protein